MARPDIEDRIQNMVDWMAETPSIVVFTGAGISTDSGLPDFRGPDGVWTRRDKGLPPAQGKIDWTKSEPNIAHHAIFELQEMGRLQFLISQNIDNLHLKSGIKPERLAELHGNVALTRCMTCERTYTVGAVTSCECGGDLKSSVVHFGDSLPVKDLEEAFYHSQNCELFIVVGSSLVVTPAANLPRIAFQSGAKLVIINKGETPLDRIAQLRFDEQIGDVLPPAIRLLKTRVK